MSQVSIIDIEGNHPQIPTEFIANIGSAIPIANILEILGVVLPAGTTPFYTEGSGNTININVQTSQAIPVSNASNIGLAAFNSNQFIVDANGFVSLAGQGLAIDSIAVQTGTSPIFPDGTGLITINGGTAAAGTNPVRSNGISANALTLQVQISQAIASTNATNIGLAAFNSAHFSVDANGFVSLTGGGQAIDSFTTDVSGPVSPDAAGNVAFTGATNIFSSGSVANTMRLNLQGTNHALFVGRGANTASAQLSLGTSGQILQSAGASSDPAWTTATYPSTSTLGDLIYASANNVYSNRAIGSTNDVLTVVGGVPTWAPIPTVSTTYNADSGSATPAANILVLAGSGSIATSATGNTVTTALTGLTNHSVLVGAGTSTITKVAPSATAGIPLVSNGSAADPSFTTAVVAGGGTGVTSTTAYGLIAGGTTSTGAFQNAGTGTSGQILVSNGSAALGTWTNQTLVLIQKQTAASSATLDFTTGLTSYTRLLIVIRGITPATNAVNFQMQQSTNGGSTWLGSGNYSAGLNTNAFNSISFSNTNSNALFPLYTGQANVAGLSGFVYVDIGGPMQINGQLVSNNGAIALATMVGQGVASVNALRFLYSSGNISGGIIYIYGLVT